MKITGFFYDGRTSGAKEVCLFFQVDTKRIRVENSDGVLLAEAEAGHVRFSEPMGNTARSVFFPCGGVFETRDNRAVETLQVFLKSGGFWRLVHCLESRWHWVLLSLVLVSSIVFLAFCYGAPLASREIALRLPPALLEKVGEHTLHSLDTMFFSPSKLSLEAQKEIYVTFQPLWDAHPDFRLQFRRGGLLGANALALPGNIIVVTDELLVLAKENPDGLEGVLAHEVGHGVHRHAARRVIQDSFLAFLIMGLTGDGSGVAELFMGLPVLMTELAYSRGFEREADAYALEWLAHRGKSPDGLAQLLIRLHENEKRAETREGAWRGYLSTHPLLEERLEALGSGP
ncbi:M48 family metallopeptidase [Desulfobotulus sp. H1]|uniref:M48 family metallopeptidase n=1 Tax=Desulfobotulus pelophilus TaxID=2823377 RepID=A0ABT3N5B9_9BACT|nr:M48 family metallopeptidase [Desulfobotulus pelophilus]MCW7752653.1 M48 family metallopeptidase [Desulfobotulus pelophilus]